MSAQDTIATAKGYGDWVNPPILPVCLKPLEHLSKQRIFPSKPSRQKPLQSAVFFFEPGKLVDRDFRW